MGTECAKRFQVFGCHVVGVARTVTDNKYYQNIVEWDKLDQELAAADIVVLAVPLTDETKNLVNESRLELLKEGSVLVNVARGGLVDTNALMTHISRLGGAVLDVFEEEPLAEESPLWDMDNVIVSPHNSFVGDGNRERLLITLLENINNIEE